MSANARRTAATGLLALALACGAGLTLRGQSTFGTILGNVVDAKGAPMPDVPVTLTDQGANVVRSMKTNEAGIFEFVDLVSGLYRLEIRQEGFKTFVKPDIELSSRQIIRVDASMELGAVAETVTVEGAAGLIESETGTISATVLGGELFFLSPNTTSQRPWDQMRLNVLVQNSNSSTRFTIAGAYHNQSEFQIDGITTPLGTGAVPMSMTLSSEALAEVKVMGVNNTAEYGSPSTTVEVSKSGTDRYHGDAYYNFDSSVLTARRADRTVKPASHDHRFGGNLGGPLRIPKLYDGHGHGFFSLSWQSLRSPGGTTYFAGVPTLNMRAGIFSGPVRDPLTGKSFPNNTIPDLRINPVSRRIQDLYYPLPTFPGQTTNNYQVVGPNPTTREELLDLRIDQHISERHWVFARVGGTQFNNRGYESNLALMGLRSNTRKLYTGVLAHTWIMRSSLVNELRLGFVRDNSPGGGSNNGLTVLKALDINFPADLQPPDARGFPIIEFGGVIQMLSQTSTVKNVSASFHFSDRVSWLQRSHSFKGGVNIFAEQPNIARIPAGVHGDFQFQGVYTLQPYGDFLLGIPTQTTLVGINPNIYMRATNYGVFFQDDYKVRPNLTLSLGLRWDYQSPVYNKNNALYNFDPATGSLVKAAPNTPINAAFQAKYPQVPIVEAWPAGLPERTLHFTDNNNFAPRIGFAWRPRRITSFVVRGGWGKFTDFTGQGVFQWFAGGGNGAFLTYGNNTFLNATPDRNGIIPATAFQFPYPFPSAYARAAAPGLLASGFNPHMANPYVQQWNLTIERALFGAGLRASYVATKSTDLIYRRDINQRLVAGNNPSRPYAGLGFTNSIDYMDNGGSQIYHGLQLEAQRRLRSGPMFSAGYTWANNISDIIDGSDQDYSNVCTDARSRRIDRGRVGFSRQHNLTAYAMWEVPFGRPDHLLGNAPGWLRRMVSRWALYPQFYAASGQWFSPRRLAANPLTVLSDETARADRIADGNDGPRLTGSPGRKWINVNAFAQPATNVLGNAGRNILEGPGFWSLHLSLSRRIPFNKKASRYLWLTVAAQDLLNHPNWQTPTGTELIVGQPAFGSTSTLLGQDRGASAASRSIMLRLRFMF
jgi:hypothetical protein